MDKNRSIKIKKGIQKARKKGVKVGRPKKEKRKNEDEVLQLLKKGFSQRKIANDLGIALSTVYKIKKENSYDTTINSLIKSKDRVKDLGEVFTPPHIVKKMCDLIDGDIRNIEDIIMEPACGTGNFLVEIVKRRLEFVEKISKNKKEYELNACKGLCIVLGIDIMKDNVLTSRNRVFDVFSYFYKKKYKQHCNYKVFNLIEYIFEKQIIEADFLTQKKPNSDEDAECYEWSYNEDGVVIHVFSLQDVFNFNKIVKEGKEPPKIRTIKSYHLSSFEELLDMVSIENYKVETRYDYMI